MAQEKQKTGWLEVLPSGARQGVIAAIVAKVVPIVLGVAVIVAGVLQHLPWAYIIAAAGVSAGVMFASVAVGLNQLAAYRVRLSEEDSLVPIEISFPVAHHTNLDDKLGVSAAITCENKATYKLVCVAQDAKFYLHKIDGTARRDCDPAISRSEKIIGAGAPATLSIGAVVIDDLKDEPSLRGRCEVKLAYGRKKTKYELHREYDVFGTRQVDGSWEFMCKSP